MKSFTLLAVTGGLFFSSLCLDSNNLKQASVNSKNSVGRCVKKCCYHPKKAKNATAYVSAKAGSVRS